MARLAATQHHQLVGALQTLLQSQDYCELFHLQLQQATVKHSLCLRSPLALYLGVMGHCLLHLT